jgi:cytochrome b subunit of formate dehydrogenase
MFVSFTALAITGLPMKYYHAPWATPLYELMGGIEWVPIIHRINAVAMTAVFVYHIFYAAIQTWFNRLKPLKVSGQLTLKNTLTELLDLPMVPNLTDLKELIATIKYWLFLTNQRPAMVGHGLKEKFGYLAVFWGVPVIGISGYMLWGQSLLTEYVPGIVLNFAYIAHSDEALLASIVIFGWHIYNTHMAPAAFPMGMAWITGELNEREMLEDHYIEYCEAMERSGLADRIRENKPDSGFTTSNSRRLFEKAWLVSMIIFFSVSTVYICWFIVDSVFGSHYALDEHAPDEHVTVIQKILHENTKDKTFSRGFRVTAEKDIKKHYHRIKLKLTPDDPSYTTFYRSPPERRVIGSIPLSDNTTAQRILEKK